jgi:hypothetical protein
LSCLPAGVVSPLAVHSIAIHCFDKTTTTTTTKVFCPATAYLPDGRILISGGSNNERVTIYDNGVWKKGTDTVLARGYHAATVTVDGSVFTMGGSWHEKKVSEDVGFFWYYFRYVIFKWFFDKFFPWSRKDGEIWDPATGRWKLLKGTKCEGSIVTDDVTGQYRKYVYSIVTFARHKRWREWIRDMVVVEVWLLLLSHANFSSFLTVTTTCGCSRRRTVKSSMPDRPRRLTTYRWTGKAR